MPSWIYSLQFRLVVSFALVLALVLGGVSVFIGLAADREAERLAGLSDRAHALRIKQALAEYYERNKSWNGVQPVLDRTGFVAGREIVVLDKDGKIIGDTGGDRAASSWKRGKLVTPLVVGSGKVGTVYVGPGRKGPIHYAPNKRGALPAAAILTANGELPLGDDDEFEEPSWSRFGEVTNRTLMWGGAAAGAAGLLLMSLTSRRMLRSVRALTSAAQRMGAGDLSQRVPEEGRDEIGQLARTFNNMADGLQSAERQRRNVVADVAHELRTPLSNIQGYVEALRDGVLEPDAATLGTVHQQVRYLTDLVEDLRLLADTEAGDFYLDREPGSLIDVVRESVEGIRARADAKGVALEANLPPGSPSVRFDRTRIAQVVGNLLDNAIRHTPTAGSVTVTASVGPAAASVSVEDTGEGIPAELLPFVFERFYRVDPSRSRATGGAGLGLTIAKQLVEAHGGSIRASSVPGEGTTITFELPLDG